MEEILPLQTQDEGGRFVPCQSCGMYQFFTYENYLLMEKQYQAENNAIYLTCCTCSENASLLLQVESLNETVLKLEDRIKSLTSIRDLEDEIDRTHENLPYLYQTQDSTAVNSDNLTDQFANYSINSENPCLDNILSNGNSDALQIMNINSSIASPNHALHIDQFSVSSYLLNTFNTGGLTKDGTAPNQTADLYHNLEVYDGPTDDGTIATTANQEVTSASLGKYISEENTNTDECNNVSDLAAAEDKTVSDPSQKIKSRHEKLDDKVRIILAGDATIPKVSLFQEQRKDECYKYVKPGATIFNTLDTVKYLATQRHRNVQKVFLHVGKNDVNNTTTEVVKEGFKLFAANMMNLNKQLIISGPVPSPGMSSEQFSRLLNLNEWLQTWTEENLITFVDHFDLFWGKKHLFKKNCDDINDLGSMLLSHNLRTSFSMLKSETLMTHCTC